MYRRAEVVLEFLDSAPVPLRMTVTASRPPDEVFAAFAHDPATWDEFFPGIVTSGCYHTPVPHGVGSGYVKRFLGVTIEERVLAWDEGKRFAFRGGKDQRPGVPCLGRGLPVRAVRPQRHRDPGRDGGAPPDADTAGQTRPATGAACGLQAHRPQRPAGDPPLGVLT